MIGKILSLTQNMWRPCEPHFFSKGPGDAMGDFQVASLSRISGVSRAQYILRQLKYFLNMYTMNIKYYRQNIFIGSKHVASM